MGAAAPPPMGAPPTSGGATPGQTRTYPGAGPGNYGAPMADTSMGGPGMGMNQAPDAHAAAIARDLEQFNARPYFARATVSKLPNSVSSKQKCGVPLGMMLQPLASLPPEVEQVPSVNFSSVGTIVRCRDCRTYINPFVQWEANGRRWVCNCCGTAQLTPDSYYAPLDDSGKRSDRMQRPELSLGTVEYIAPGEYCVRPPQPPVFMFVIDVSYTSVASGMLDTVVATIKETIQSGSIPGGSRTQVGIITFDTSLHFYNLNSNLSQPQMLVVSDLEDLFLPLPDDILVQLSESQDSIINLLDLLPTIFADTKINESCLGSAVKGAFMAMKHIGGKMLVFGACIPSVGKLSLKSTRDNPRLLGTDREVELLRPNGDGYKELATELTRHQIAVELFLAPQAYVDLASIAPLAKNTGGDVRYYPQFHIQTQGLKLKTELMHVLTRYMGWEAVMRVRVSRGWKITQFYGHLFIRSADLLVVPNCHVDQTFGLSFDMEENISLEPVLYVQSALLYTNSDGERRIRVSTWAGITTQNYTDIMGSIDVQATACMLSQCALDHSLKTTLAEGRNRLQQQCQHLVQAGNMCPTVEALQFLPLYIMGMLKSMAFRATNDVSADMRTCVWQRLETLNVVQMSAYFYPRMMALHNCEQAEGMPEMLNLTSESMSQDGCFLLEDGDIIQLWFGRGVNPSFLQALFGVSTLEELDNNSEAVLGTRGDAISTKVASIIQQVRIERSVPFLQVHLVRPGDHKELRFFASLIEDRTVGLQQTYEEFLQRCGYRPPQQQQQAPPQGAMPPRR